MKEGEELQAERAAKAPSRLGIEGEVVEVAMTGSLLVA